MTGTTIVIISVFLVFLVATTIGIYFTYSKTNKVIKENTRLADEIGNQRKTLEELQKEMTATPHSTLAEKQPTDAVGQLQQQTALLRHDIKSTSEMTDSELLAWLDVQMMETCLFRNPDLTLKMIAQQFGLTQKRVQQIIKDSAKYENLYDYLTEKRFLYACDLLKEHPAWTIDAIRQEAGFASRSTFQREFKNRLGITPAKYREYCQSPRNATLPRGEQPSD